MMIQKGAYQNVNGAKRGLEEENRFPRCLLLMSFYHEVFKARMV
jgi:hypothetical protein